MESSKEKLANYANAAIRDTENTNYHKDRAQNSRAANIVRGNPEGAKKDVEAINKADDRLRRRERGAHLYTRKMMKKEEVEIDEAIENLDEAQIDELSKETLKSYVNKAAGSANKAHWKAQSPKRMRDATREKAFKKHSKREKGIGSAAKRGVTGSDMSISLAKRHERPHTRDYNWHDNPNDGDWKKRLKKDVAKDPKTHSLTGKPAPYKHESVQLSEADIAELLRQYALSENITADQLANLTEEELNELIGKLIGGAAKLAGKGVVGAAKLAAKGIRRYGTVAGRADAAEKKADRAEKKNRDRERIRKAQARLAAARKAAAANP